MRPVGAHKVARRRRLRTQPNWRSRMGWVVVLVGAFSLLSSQSLRAQDYLTSSGVPNFAAPQPVELGFTDTANGRLHLEIPIGSFAQRGSKDPLNLRLVYDSAIWDVVSYGLTGTWSPKNGLAQWGLGGWAVPVPGLGGVQADSSDSNDCLTNWEWDDRFGTKHFFPLKIGNTANGCPATASGLAADSSGFLLNVSNLGSQYSVYAPDGTLMSQAPNSQDSKGNYILSKDSNGNYISGTVITPSFFFSGPASDVYDTLGRPVLYTVPGCENSNPLSCLNVPNSQGTTSQYVITTAFIDVNTSFHQSNVTECTTNPGVCTVEVIQSIKQPDLSSYSFQYDCDPSLSGNNSQICGSPTGQGGYYGLLTKVTLPSGGQITYGYTTFTDSYGNKGRWLTSRTSSGGVWSYVPQVVSTCSATQVGCQQKVTVTKPSGDYTVTTFTLNNGAWPVQLQTYAAGNVLVSTVNNTWDFSQACPFTSCYGAAYIRMTDQLTTVYLSQGGNITKKTHFDYHTPQDGLVTDLKEWRFLAGSSPSFPATADRATYTTYLKTGTNDINKPLSVTVCNNSGSSSYCGGAGSPVTQTLYTYDAYGSGLTSKTGYSNHDDSNFGSTYTTRGNPTQISNWVSGTQYLNTGLSYDTTGQVTESLDPKNNATTYSYTDKFYSDNGANPPSTYTPTQPTNAYLTGVTTALGTENAGYYFGSGNQALYTDLNTATTYGHYLDPFDRPTETIFPIGWNLSKYTSVTQTDVYDSVADALALQSCSSCQHSEYVFDSLGRESSRKLVNNPLGTVSVDTSYDANGRVYTVSHPYVSGPVYETYAYDSLDRTTQDKHPDNQSVQALYGSSISASQQASATVYGYGYPVLGMDEGGKSRLKWVDGFGRSIEVDDGVSVSPPTYATGSIGFSSVTSSTQTIYVGSWSTNFYFTVSTPVTEVAQGVASALNGSGLVTASASGSTVNVTSVLAGSVGNYLLSGSGFSAGYSGLSGGRNSSTSSQSYAAYVYDAADHLTQVVQGSQTRTFAYDGLGRVTQETTPEAGAITLSYTTSGSPCSGDPGDVCSKTDARGLTTSYSYDTANRVTTKTNSAGTVSYYYDQGGAGAHAIGRLTEMVDPSGSETYTYDPNGRITSLRKVVGSTTYTTSYQYLGGTDELTQITYPSGRVVQQGYNAIGQLCVVAGQISPTSCSGYTTPFATGYSYDPTGNVTALNYGNGVAASFSFSPLREQLSSLSYVKGSTALFSLNYWYQQTSGNCPNGAPNNNGQIQCITDNAQPGRTVAYSYDQMFRLLSAKTNGSATYAQWGVAETYDEYGNRWTQAVTAGSAPAISLSFGPSGMNSSTTNRPNGYTYDASGNLTIEPLSPANNYTYDANNRLTSFSGGGGSGSYTYDDNGLRVKKTANGTTTVSIYSGSQVIAEYDNGAAPTSPSREYIYADSDSGTQLLALVSGSTTTYYHEDHLSVRVITDANGNKLGEQGHYPFGESWYNASNDKLLFTSYDRDSESGLDYAMARYYNSRVAAFCSADPVEGDPDDPQSWNRYAYVRNDPINLEDPSGRNWLTVLFQVLLDIFAFASGNPELAGVNLGTLLTNEIPSLVLEGEFMATQQGQNEGQQHPAPSMPAQPPVEVPPGYTKCSPVNAEVTVVGPHQAHHAAALDPQRQPNNGEVAIRPRDYGVDYPGTAAGNGAAQQTIKDADMRIYPDWGNATDAHNGKPAGQPNYGGPQGPMVPLRPIDIIGPPKVRNDPNRPTSIDIYRSNKPTDLNVPVTVVMKQNDKIHCPR